MKNTWWAQANGRLYEVIWADQQVVAYADHYVGHTPVVAKSSRIQWDVDQNCGALYQLPGGANMGTIKRKDLVAAKRRGKLNGQQVKGVYPTKHRRTCVTCSRKFSPVAHWRKDLFGCGCCAHAYGDPSTVDRRIAKGMRVVIIDTGELGTVVTIPMPPTGVEPAATIRTKNGDTIRHAENVERAFALHVEHSNGCRHGMGLKKGDES